MRLALLSGYRGYPLPVLMLMLLKVENRLNFNKKEIGENADTNPTLVDDRLREREIPSFRWELCHCVGAARPDHLDSLYFQSYKYIL